MQRHESQETPASEARTPFVEIRLAALLISPPKKRTLPDCWQGPSTPPVKGIKQVFALLPKDTNRQWLLDVAWSWRGSHVTPEVEISVHVPPESHLLEIERVAPHCAAHYRQQIADTIAGNKRMKLTRTIARVQQLIVDQYGWPERD